MFEMIETCVRTGNTTCRIQRRRNWGLARRWALLIWMLFFWALWMPLRIGTVLEHEAWRCNGDGYRRAWMSLRVQRRCLQGDFFFGILTWSAACLFCDATVCCKPDTLECTKYFQNTRLSTHIYTL